MNLKKWWSLPFCLAGLCMLALSSHPAHAQLLKYQVMGVVYAPPGSASTVTYGQSTSVGSTNTFTSTNTNDNVLTTSISFGAGLFGFGSDITLGFSNEYTIATQTSNSVQIEATKGNSISTMGPISSSLGVDHDNDVIYIWLNPVVNASLSGSTLDWTGISSNSCDPNFGPSSAYQGVDGCDPNQYPYPDVVGIPVWCLKNPYYPSPSCSQWLPYTSRSWDQTNWGTDPNTGLPLGPGLTLRDYADILQADPFVALNGSEINVCHTSYGTTLDPNLPETISAPLAPAGIATLDKGISTSEESAIGGIGFVDYASYTPSAYNSAATSTSIPTGDANACSSNLAATSAGNATSYGTANVYRFSPVGTVEYPVPGPNGLPSTYTGNFQSSTLDTDGSISTDTHAVGASVSFGFSWGPKTPAGCFFGCGSFSIGDSNTYTTQQQSSTSNTASKTYTAAYSVTGPQLSDNYIGPATYNVYLDKVYGTFAFYSDIEPPVTPAILGTIGINVNGVNCNVTSTTPCLSVSVPDGGSSALYPIILTNDSPNPMTLPGPAVTFTDPGFQLDEADLTDHCSNQQIQPGQTCTANFSFVPVPSDAPIAIYATSAVVNADLIAAGTVNISSTSQVAAEQNILVTNYGLVRGTVTGSSKGGTLVPVETPAIVLSASNPPPYLYSFGTANAVKYQQFKFTNNYNSIATIGKITYSDNTDFFTESGTDGCTGTQITANGGSCTFTVEYDPTSNLATYLTSISVVGTVPGWYGGETFQLASAGATANAGILAISTAGETALVGTYYIPGDCAAEGYPASCGQGWNDQSGVPGPSGSITVTNNSGYTATLVITTDGTVGPELVSTGACPASLTNASSCTMSISVGSSPSLCTPAGGGDYQTSCTYSASGWVKIVATPSTGTAVTDTIDVSASITEVSEGDNSNAVPITIHGAEKSTTETVAATAATASLTVNPVAATSVPASASTSSASTSSGPAPVTGPAPAKSSIVVKIGAYRATVQTAAGSSAATVAQAIAKALNLLGSPVKATASGAAVSLTSLTQGTAANLALSVTPNADFKVSTSASTLTGGKNATTTTKYDAGLVKLATNGVTASAQWGKGSTAATVATALAASVNKVASAYWSATASGDVVTLTSVSGSSASVSKKAAAAAASPTITVSDSEGFSPASFEAATN